MSIQNSGCNVPKTYKTSCKIRCQNKEQSNARQGCDKFLFAAIEEKKDQTKIYKNAIEMYRKRLKIITSK
jgi:hypothetical protein